MFLKFEDTLHYFFYCRLFSQFRSDLINSVKSLYENFECFSGKVTKDVLLYGDSTNRTNLEEALTYITIP